MIEGLWASPPEALPFGRSLQARAFVLQRPGDNLLVYRSQAVEGEAEAIDGMGGLARQYLNHHHEAAPVCDWVTARFNAPLSCHAQDEPSVSGVCEVRDTFSERHTSGDDFEIVPIPGHTPGATAFVWQGPQNRCLFSGDSVWVRDGEWAAAVLRDSDRRRYIESLELLREIDFDVLVPWIADAGEPIHHVVYRAQGRRRIDAIVRRLRQGETA